MPPLHINVPLPISSLGRKDDIRGIREISERGGEKFEANYFNIPPVFRRAARDEEIARKMPSKFFPKLRDSPDNSWPRAGRGIPFPPPACFHRLLSTMHRQTRKYAGRQTEVRNSINL